MITKAKHLYVLSLALLATALILLLQNPVQAAWYNNGWAKRIKITIDSAKVNGDLTNFPVFVDLDDLPDAFFDTVNGSGADIVVTDNGGTTVLKRELVSIDTTANDGELWFKAASLSSTSNSDFYIYYTNGDAALTNDTDTWPSGYIFVSHFETDPTGSANDVADSTSNNNDGSSQGTMAGAVAGQIGNGYDFDETDDYVDYGDISTINGATTYSISAWVYTSSSASAGTFFAKGSSGDAIEIWDDISGGPTYYFFPTQDSDDYSAPSSNTDVWEHVVMVYNGNEASADDALKYYLNGSLQTWDSSTSPASSFAGNTDSIYVGYDSVGTVYHGGKIDEIRLTTEDLSEAWVATEYNNQKSPDTFYSVGSIENRALGDSGWSAKTKITVLSSAIDATLTDFPVYVDLSDLPDSFFSTVNGSGADIRVTKSDQGSELAFELVAISTTDNTGELWFKADSLSSSSNTDFWIFYGNGDASAYSNGDTYGSDNAWDSNFIGVYHFQTDPSSSVPDSTGNSNSGTSSGSMGSGHVENGHIGKAYHFDGSDDVISLGDITAFNELTFTMTAWAKRDATGVRHPILTKEGTGPSSSQIPLHINFESGNHVRFKTCNSAGTDCSNDTDVTGFTSTSDYYHVAVSRSGTAGSVYKDSVETTDTKQSTIYANTGPLKIGARNSTGSPGWMDGYIDEVHISSVQRSDAWIIAEFNNQNGTSNFYSIADAVAPTVSTYSPADGANNVGQGQNLIITFDEIVHTMTGDITIKKLSDDSTFETIPVGDARVTGNGTTTITINPANGMAASTDYYVNIAATCFDDASGNSYAGITDNGTWNFTVPWYNGDWLKRIKITIDSSKVNGDVTNFPVYVDLDDMPDAFFDNVDVNGADLRVTNGDGLTEVACEVVTISTTGNTGELHFQANGTLSGSSNSDWFLYYDNSGATEAAEDATYGRENIWSSASYVGVWHLQEDPSSESALDSTSSDMDASSAGSMTNSDRVPGQLSNGMDFDGSNDYLNAGDSTAVDMGSGNFSFSAWVKRDTTGSQQMIFGKDIVSSRQFVFFVNSGNTFRTMYNTPSSVYRDTSSTITDTSGWHHIFGQRNGNSFDQYLDGSLDGSGTTSGTHSGMNAGTVNLNIGRRPYTSFENYWDGRLDEIRIASAARSADWVVTEYNNQNSPSTFYSVGTVESSADTTSPTVSTYSPTDGATDIASTANLVLTFDEAVYTMTGNITIKKLSDDSTFETIPVGDARVTGNGSTTITINPANGMAASTDYYVNIAATCFDDAASNSYAGITDNGTWNFTTAAGGGGAVSNGWTNSAWGSRLKFTVNGDQVNGDLTDFPVYIDLSDLASTNFFSNVRSDGGEIRITQGDGLTLLATELVSIDTTNNQGELWFKAPFLDGSADTSFYIYYNNANATTLNAAHKLGRHNVWTNGYVAVYHFNEDPNGDVNGSLLNSVSNSLHGTPTGSMTSADKVAGQIGNGSHLDGSNDYFTAASTGISMDNGTVSAWANKDVNNADFGIWQIYTSGSDHLSLWCDGVGGGSDDAWSLKLGGTDIVTATTAITSSGWHHVATSYDFTNDNYEIYQDGVNEASSTTSYTADTLTAEQDIGLDDTGDSLDGILDELHIADKIRTEAWIDTEYNNQNSASTFYTIGSNEGVNDDGLPKPTLTYPRNRQDRFPLAANLFIEFNENVQAGSGNITIKELSNGGTFEAIAIGSATISGTRVTINPSSNLASGIEYYVEIDDGAIEDTGSNAFIGFRNSQSWRFTTEGGSSTTTSPASIFLFGE